MFQTHTGHATGHYASAPILTTRAGLCAGTRVMTLDGHLPVEYLNPGDHIITSDGTRQLKALHAFRLTDCPVSIRRDAFGPGRPVAELRLGPDQQIRPRDWRGGALWGSDLDTLPVERLIDRDRLAWAEHPGELLAYQLEFHDFHSFYAEGLEVISHLPNLALLETAAA